MKLIYNNTLCSVYNKCASVGHHGNITHVNLLLTHFHIVFFNEIYCRLKRRSKSHIAFFTFRFTVLRLADFIVHEFKRKVFIRAVDWKCLNKYSLQTVLFSFRRGYISLKEPIIGFRLNLYHVRDFNTLTYLPEINYRFFFTHL